MNSGENFMSVFGEYHRQKRQNYSEDRIANQELVNHVREPLEGVDYLHEDSKAETQKYQDIYDSMLIEEVRVTRCAKTRT